MNAHIITIGNELLIGQVIDTNSAWLGEMLTELGISVECIISIQDDEGEIIDQLDESSKSADVVIVSGGLGPTKDDITKTSIAKFLNVGMKFNQDVYQSIIEYLKKHDRKVPDIIKAHAYFPEGCIFLKNNLGTAPGMVFRENKSIIISVPGVPYEMKYIMENEGLPLLATKSGDQQIVQKTILTVGEFEARLAERLHDVIEALPPHFSVAYLPNLVQVRVRLTAKGNNIKQLDQEMEIQVQKIRTILGKQIFGYGKKTLEEVVGQLLVKKGLHLSTAESCTGGYISHLITKVSGSSAYYKGSIISYSNEMKINQLGVSQKVLEEFGAVSEQCVQEMVNGVLKSTNTDIGLAISGIAGPDGGSEEKPVGTIWLACGNHNKTVTKKIKLGKDRLKNIQSSAIHALDLLRIFIIEKYA